METWIAVSLASVIFSYAVSRIKIYIKLNYRRKAADDQLSVDVYFIKHFFTYHLDVPVVRIMSFNGLPWLKSEVEGGEEEVDTNPKRERRFAENMVDIYRNRPRKWRRIVKDFKHYTKLYNKFIERIMRRLTCEKISWQTRFGSDDAAVTSMGAGLFWLLKSQIYAFLKRRVKFAAKPEFQVIPVFSAIAFDVELECIFSIRLGNVINATLSQINFPRKGVKDSGRAPNTKFNENCNGKH